MTKRRSRLDALKFLKVMQPQNIAVEANGNRLRLLCMNFMELIPEIEVGICMDIEEAEQLANGMLACIKTIRAEQN